MMWGVLAGALGLIVLEVALTPRGSGNVAGGLGVLSKGIAWVISPAVPGIPNLAAAKSTTATSSSTSPATSTLL